MKIILFGGTGFIGHTLVPYFIEKGHSIVLVSRHPRADMPWLPDAATLEVVRLRGWETAFVADMVSGCDVVINLIGKSLFIPWTRKNKKAILESRITTTRAIAAGILAAPERPQLLINASAVGYYGDVPEGDVTEDHPPGHLFLSEVCRKWEQEALAVEKGHVRCIRFRMAPVLGGSGGILQAMKWPFLFFLGGPVGPGSQWLPWIHIQDVAHSMEFLMETPNIHGAVNGTSPFPVTMDTFSRTLAGVLKRPSFFRAPSFLVRMILGEMSQMVLTGQKAVPAVLQKNGFHHSFPELRPALDDLLK